jgi:hypothetical protein
MKNILGMKGKSFSNPHFPKSFCRFLLFQIVSVAAILKSIPVCIWKPKILRENFHTVMATFTLLAIFA